MKSFLDGRITLEIFNIPETRKAAFRRLFCHVCILQDINSEIIPTVFLPVVRFLSLYQ